MERKAKFISRRTPPFIILVMTLMGSLLCSCGFRSFSRELARIPKDVIKYDLLLGDNSTHETDKDSMDLLLGILLNKGRSATTRDPESKRIALDVRIFYTDYSKATMAISIFPTKDYASTVYGSTRISGSFQVKLSKSDMNEIKNILLKIVPREQLE